MPFDKLLYDSDASLKARGKEAGQVLGVMLYCLSSYADLSCILGTNWHLRGINQAGDCCYVILETSDFFYVDIENKWNIFQTAPVNTGQEE